MSTSHPPSPHIYPLDASQPVPVPPLSSPASTTPSPLVHHHPSMGQPKQHNALSIVLPSPFVCLRGTGVSVDPSVLRGHVLLELSEATAFKEINLQFRGKARLPASQGESSSVLGGNYSNNVIFNHEWSFLQGELTHTPTLKAGRHVFPFTLQIEDWLPSTLSIHSGLAGISYKLRATAVRPGFSSNLHAVSPVRILRSFPSEALEYQQTLELENTWPEKLMYAIMVPHKAWAAGDTLCALVKFSPLSKGIRITGITTSLHEHLKTFGRSGATHDENRVACSVKHEIQNGRAVSVPYFSTANSLRWTQQHNNHSPFSTNLSTPSASDDARSSSLSEPSTVAASSPPDTPLLIVTPSGRNTNALADGSSLTGSTSLSLAGNSSSATIAVAPPCLTGDTNFDIGDQEIVTTLELPLPATLTPTHAVEPIILSHRLRWNILLSNPDGHVSELRCSLPIHILDNSIIEDARAATRVTRRLLFGLEITQDDGDEAQLPSYPSHVMDRVPDDEEQAAAALATQNGTPSGLDWVNMQLMTDGQRSHPTTPPDSRLTSRTSSRAPSPERRDRERGHHGFFSSLKPFTKVTSSFSNHSRQSNHASHMHGDNNNSSSHTPDESSSSSLSLTLSPSHGSATPLGSFPPTPDRSQPGTPPLSHTTVQNGIPQRRPISASASASASRTNSPRNAIITLPGVDSSSSSFTTTTSIDNEVAALSRVPHYAIASRGFLGGITPISSLRGLPSYEEASRPSRTTAASPVSTTTTVVDSLPSSHSLGRQLPALMPIQNTRDMSRRSAAERSFSEGDLAARFANVSQRL